MPPARLLLLLAVLTLGCAEAFRPARPDWPKLPDGHFMHVGSFLQVTGTARPDRDVENKTQRKALAKDAGLLDAWSRLTAYLESLPRIDGGSVGGLAGRSPEFRAKIETLVRSASVVSVQYDVDGTAAVVVRISKPRLNKVLGTDFR